MILVCGMLADQMIELMCARLNDMGYPYFFFDQTQFPGAYQITWEVGHTGVTGYATSPSETVRLEEVTGVYARYVAYRTEQPPELINKHEQAMVEAENQYALMQLFDLMPCVVVNRPKASVSNDSKIYQQLVIQSAGFLTPKTLATTIAEEAIAFYEACHKNIIYKSISSERSIVQRLTEKDFPRLKLLANCPAQFQEYVEGVDIRVHTVGEEVFPTEMRSEASDYRYATSQGEDLTMRAIEIPPDVAEVCVNLARAFGLVAAGIDLRRTPDDRYYCFEVNPSPAFIFYERATGQPISEAVARILRGS